MRKKITDDPRERSFLLKLEIPFTIFSDGNPKPGSQKSREELDQIESYLQKVLNEPDDGRLCFNGELFQHTTLQMLKAISLVLKDRSTQVYFGHTNLIDLERDTDEITTTIEVIRPDS